MSKFGLRDAQMTDAAYVDQAADWAKNLISRESRGPGDTDNAMRRIEARYGIPFQSLWALRYRKPKGVFVSLYNRLHAAYRAECDRQLRLLQHEITVTEAITGPDNAIVLAAQTVVDKEDS